MVEFYHAARMEKLQVGGKSWNIAWQGFEYCWGRAWTDKVKFSGGVLLVPSFKGRQPVLKYHSNTPYIL